MIALPEVVLINLLRTGIASLKADPTGFDAIFDGIDGYSSGEIDKIKDYFALRTPDVQLGFARRSTNLPLMAVLLTSERDVEEYLGQGIEPYIVSGAQEGFSYRRRLVSGYTIYIYADNADVCAWTYTVCRAIINIGTPSLLALGFDAPKLDGADLLPQPEYNPDNLFQRRLTVQLEREECWTDSTALWQALNGDPEQFLSASGTIDVAHEDAGGKVTPYDE